MALFCIYNIIQVDKNYQKKKLLIKMSTYLLQNISLLIKIFSKLVGDHWFVEYLNSLKPSANGSTSFPRFLKSIGGT